MKLRIKFAKSGPMKFIGHLDVMRYFQKAIRRAGIDIAYTEGFSPHQIMSFAAPLGVGLISEGEYLDIQVHHAAESGRMTARLNQVMVDGMRVLSVKRLPKESKNAMSIVTAADYRISFYKGCPDGFAAFMAQKELPVTKRTKKSETVLDIRPLIYEYRVDSDSIFLRLATGSASNLKPELVMETFAAFSGRAWDPFSCQICRLELYMGTPQEGFVSLESLGENIESDDLE